MSSGHLSAPEFHLVFLDEDRDLIVRSFETRESLDEFVEHFEDYIDHDGEDANDDFWRFGYTPKHVIFAPSGVETHS